MQYGIKEVLDMTILDFASKDPVTYIDYALASTNEVTAERQHIHGGRGMAHQLSFDGQKESVLNLTIPLVDLNLLGHIAGDKVINDTTSEVLKTERIPVKKAEGEGGGFTIEITDTPIGTPSVYKVEGLRDFGESVEASWSDKQGTIAADADLQESDELYVLYQHTAPKGSKEIKVRTDVFPREVQIHGKGLARLQKDGLDYPTHITVHKARPRADFTFTMDGSEPTSLEIVFDMSAVRDADGESTYISYIFEDENDTP